MAAGSEDRATVAAGGKTSSPANNAGPNGKHTGGLRVHPRPAGEPDRRCTFRTRRAPATHSRSKRPDSCADSHFSFRILPPVIRSFEPDAPRPKTRAPGVRTCLPIGAPETQPIARHHAVDVRRVQQTAQILEHPDRPSPAMAMQAMQVD